MGARLVQAQMDPHTVSSQLWAEQRYQRPQLLLESLVEVEVDKGVVNVGAFGEERGENEALRSHVATAFVENEQEGDNSVRGPGDDEAQTDAEEHLKPERKRKQDHELVL